MWNVSRHGCTLEDKKFVCMDGKVEQKNIYIKDLDKKVHNLKRRQQKFMASMFGIKRSLTHVLGHGFLHRYTESKQRLGKNEFKNELKTSIGKRKSHGLGIHL